MGRERPVQSGWTKKSVAASQSISLVAGLVGIVLRLDTAPDMASTVLNQCGTAATSKWDPFGPKPTEKDPSIWTEMLVAETLLWIWQGYDS